MQGISHFIPTETKINYINQLMKVGFDTIDFGSFVSPKAIPQMRDTAEVLAGIQLNKNTKLLAITANLRGAENAMQFSQIDAIGFPLSVSETFQLRNTNSGLAEAMLTVKAMKNHCDQHQKELVVYLSMAFGNPYGDPWNVQMVQEKVKELADLGITTISLADTVGLAQPDEVSILFSNLISSYSVIKFGAHLHCTPGNWKEKVSAAWYAGCKRFDSAMKGFGGCPMANDELVGNLASENLLTFLDEHGIEAEIDSHQFNEALQSAYSVFSAS